jgi:hypothetical protein
MKKIAALLLLTFLLSGCVTYKIQPGKPPFDKGYVVTRDGYQIPEYTVGKNGSVPDKDVAEQRFKRRQKTVESYYMKMGIIESRFTEYVWNPPVTILKAIGGFFRLPFVMASDRKYETDPKYRAQIDKEEDEQFEKEKARIKGLREELNIYVQKDLLVEEERPETKVPAVVPAAAIVPAAKSRPVTDKVKLVEPGLEEAQPIQPATIEEAVTAPVEIKPPVVLPAPVPVIVARPTKGFSPLRVQFYGSQSHSPNGKIVSYEWDFGDGDISKLPKPANTFLSATYGSRIFIVTLTVIDSKGQRASANTSIEVLTK